MSRVNLLPPEYLADRGAKALARRIRRYALIAAGVLALVYVGRTGQIIYLDRQIDHVRAAQASVQQELDGLAAAAAARDAASAAASVTADVLRGEVAWSEQLLAVAQTVPAGMVLTSVSGQVVPGQSAGVVGSVTFTAVSVQLPATPVLLTKIAAQEGWANGWVSSVAADGGAITVNGSFDLTPDAVTVRGGGPA